MKTLLLAGLTTLALAGTAHAQRESNLTGAKLVTLCTSDPKSAEGCEAYIDGVADAASFYQRLRPMDGSKGGVLPDYLCVPAAITGVQLRQSVVDWYKKHDGSANMQASGIVLRALRDTYQCPGRTTKPKP